MFHMGSKPPQKFIFHGSTVDVILGTILLLVSGSHGPIALDVGWTENCFDWHNMCCPNSSESQHLMIVWRITKYSNLPRLLLDISKSMVLNLKWDRTYSPALEVVSSPSVNVATSRWILGNIPMNGTSKNSSKRAQEISSWNFTLVESLYLLYVMFLKKDFLKLNVAHGALRDRWRNQNRRSLGMRQKKVPTLALPPKHEQMPWWTTLPEGSAVKKDAVKGATISIMVYGIVDGAICKRYDVLVFPYLSPCQQRSSQSWLIGNRVSKSQKMATISEI